MLDAATILLLNHVLPLLFEKIKEEFADNPDVPILPLRAQFPFVFDFPGDRYRLSGPH